MSENTRKHVYLINLRIISCETLHWTLFSVDDIAREVMVVVAEMDKEAIEAALTK